MGARAWQTARGTGIASRLWAPLALVAALALHAAIFLPLIPASGKGLGDDYSLHLPNLLAGYFYVLTNGPFSPPWFSPAECGGVPYLADPNVAFYSLPQWLTFVVDPLTAVRLTFVIFAAIGAAGAFVLMRRRFAVSREAALTTAVLFLFNGLYAYRLAAGHLTFHPIALAPWLAYVMLPDAAGGGLITRRHGAVTAAILAGALTAYEFQAGMVHGIIPVAIAVAVILLIHGHRFGHRWRPWLAFAGATVLSLALSASRLTAALAFLHNFPREGYPLPGFPDLLTALRFALEAVFGSAPAETGWQALVNRGVWLERHEWEYSVGTAAVPIVAGALAIAATWLRHGIARERLARGVPVAAAILVALALPILLNWYTPSWNALLKRTPILASSTNLLRWFMLYIPIVAVAAGLAVDRVMGPGGMRIVFALTVTATTVALAAYADKSHYRAGRYDAGLIVASWHKVRRAADVPPVTRLARGRTLDGVSVGAGGKANLLALGASQIDCYQPMFGYFSEHFPLGALRPGPTLQPVNADALNIKNPACYLFPAENGCAPGAEFRPDQIAAATAFAAYRPFPFAAPAAFRLAGWVNAIALVLSLVAVVTIAGRWLVTRGAGRGR